MTATTTINAAAQRLLLAAVSPDDDAESIVNRSNLMDEALAAERRATVEHIKEQYSQLPQGPYRLLAIWDILKEAAR